MDCLQIILSTALNTESLEIEQRICQRLSKCNGFPDHCWGDYLCNFLCGTVFVSLRSGWLVKWLKWTEDGLFGTGKVVLVLNKNSEWCKWLHSYWWSVHVFLQAAWVALPLEEGIVMGLTGIKRIPSIFVF